MKNLYKYGLFIFLLIAGGFFLYNNFISNYNEQIRKTKNEISGVVFAEKIQEFILKIQQLRGFSQFTSEFISDENKKTIEDEVQYIIIKIRKDIREIRLLKNPYPNLYSDDYDHIISEVMELIQDKDSSPEQLFQRYTYIIEKLKEKMYHLGFKSELLLETDRDKYFLVNVMLTHIPNLIETTAKIRGEVSKSILDGSATLELRYSLRNSCLTCNEHIKKIEKIFSSMSSDIEKARLMTMLSGIEIESKKMKEYVKKTISSTAVDIDAIDFFIISSGVIDKIFSLYITDAEFLKKELEDKKRDLEQTKLYGIVIGAIVLLFVLVTIFSMIRTSVLYLRSENRIKDNLTAIINLKNDLKECLTIEEISSKTLLFFASRYSAVEGIMYLYNEENEKLYLSGSYATITEKPILEIGEGIIGEAAAQKKHILTNFSSRKNKFLGIGTRDMIDETIYSIPLIDNKKLVGVIQLCFLTQMDIMDNVEFQHFIDIIVGFLHDAKHTGINKKYIELIDKNVITSATNKEGVITEVSEAFAKKSGYTKEELIGKKHNIVAHPDTPVKVYKELWKTILSGKIWQGELRNRTKNGNTYWVEMTITPLTDRYKTILGFTAILHDITDKKRIEEISITDGLTGLYNRHFFDMIFPREYNTAKRERKNIVFLIIDIDFFKQYNDSYGHLEGDKVLKLVSITMKKYFKRSNDYIFRLGGEEFGILFNDKTQEEAFKKANDLRSKIEELNMEHKKSSVSKYLTISAGLFCISPECNINLNDIYKEADNALYLAKNNGRNKIEQVNSSAVCGK